MKFGTFPIDDAEGLILAHAVVTPSRRYKKGYQLTAADLALLKDEAISEVMGAHLEEGDVPEDQAAKRLAEWIAGPGCILTTPFTGRCNLTAETAGVLILDDAQIRMANKVNEAITLATLPMYSKVEAGQTIATAKIIPFSCRETDLAKIENTVRSGHQLLAVRPFVKKKITLISTVLTETKSTVMDKSRAVLEERLEACGNHLHGEMRCNHEQKDLSSAIETALLDGSDLVLIFGASAITDRADIIPSAIETTGGTVDHLGMPVDPGNLLLLAHKGRVPIIGLPGCARSPKLNGFDWVLERLLADVPITPEDIMDMGVGGLLKEIPTRPQPREKRVKDAQPPSIGAIILAAGQSTRMGSSNKLLADVDGKPMVQHVADAISACGFDKTIVVTGHEEEKVRDALSSYSFDFAHNEHFAEGLSSSLKTGIKAFQKKAPHIDGVVVCLGDMPKITQEHLSSLVTAFSPDQAQQIVVPTHNGKRGNPVLWAANFFSEILELKGDVGARSLIGQHEESLVEVPLQTDAIFLDIDTPAALQAHRKNSTS